MLRQMHRFINPLLQRAAPLAPRACWLHYPSPSATGPSGSSIRLSWSKDIMNKVVPFTGDLIGTNQISFEGAAVRYYSESLEPTKDTSLKKVEDSWVEIILPFSDHLKLRNDMMLADQCSIRYGKLFEILDSLAADVSMRHAGGRDHRSGEYSMSIVTAAIDKMYIYKDIGVLSDVVLRGYIGHVGSSSMEVCIDILNTDEEVLGQTMFIMVARDPASGGAVRVPKLEIETAEGRRRYLQGEMRAKMRKERRASSLASVAPNSSETELIHSLYLQSVRLKEEKDNIIKTAMSEGRVPIVEHSRKHTQVKWTKDTVFRNAYLMYPQDRNLHGNIFGGHILRRAFEAARVSASIFFGTEDNIAFQAVDEIHFVKPVPVGSIVEFTSTVTYSERNLCVVNVTAQTVDVASGIKDMTNSFNYMFSVPLQFVDSEHLKANSIICSGDTSPKINKLCDVMGEVDIEVSEACATAKVGPTDRLLKLPRVVPREYYEIVHYLEGRRSLRHLLELKAANVSSHSVQNDKIDASAHS